MFLDLLNDPLERLSSVPLFPYGLPAAVCCVLCVAYFCFKQNPYDIFRIPGAPSYAILGHIPYFATGKDGVDRRVQLLSGWAREYGPFVRLELGFGQRWILVADPTAAAKVISRGPEAHDKDVSHYKIYSRLSKARRGARTRVQGTISTSSTDEHWKAVRRGLAVAFNSRNIRKGFDLVRQKALELADILARAGPDKTFDADEMGLRLTLDVIGTAGFGYDFKALQTPDCPLLDILPQVVDYCEMHDGFSELVPEFFFQLSKRGKHGAKCVKEFQDIVGNLMAKVKAAGPPSEDDTSMAAQLQRVIDPKTGKPLSDDSIVGEVGNVLIAGFETSGHTLSYILLELATHLDIQERVVQELVSKGLATDGVGGAAARQLEYGDLGDLPFLNDVIRETMRLHSVGTGTRRKTGDQPAMLGPYLLPPKTTLVVSTNVTHLLPWAFDDPWAFKPDRWKDDNGYFTPGANSSRADIPAGMHSSYIDWYLWKRGNAADTKAEPSKLSSLDSAMEVLGSNISTKVFPEEVTAGDSKCSSEEQEGVVDVDDLRGSRAGRARKFIPFSDGPRSCIGQSMAIMELRTTLALLLPRFHFSLAPEAGTREDVLKHEVLSLTLQVRGGVKLRAAPR